MKRESNRLARDIARVLAACAAGTALVSPALAQEEAPQTRVAIGQLEEVVVTGTKREEALQDVPVTVSAVTAESLALTKINDVRALDRVTPGLVLSAPAGFNATGGGMRGTGTNIILVTQDAPVSFLMDEFVLSHVTSQFLTLFDVQQVEVYRGPQGTLFGKNTTGGVISITSKKPVIGEYSGETELSFGTYENGASVMSLKAAANLPISDTLAFRFAGIYDKSDGYYTADKTNALFPDNVPLYGAIGIPAGTPLPDEVDTTASGAGGRLGGKDVLAAKAKLLWEPNDTYSAYLIFEGVQDRSDSPPGVNESIATDLLTALGFPGIQLTGQGNPFSTLISGNDDIQMDKGHRVDTLGVYLTQDINLAVGKIKSITGYREEEQRLPSTYTGEAFQTLFDSTRNTERYTFQQELRFASDFDGPFNFVAGANYFEDTFNFRAFFSVGLVSLLPLCILPPFNQPCVRADGRVNLDTRSLFDYQLQYTEQDRTEYAFFWDGSYDVTDRLRLSAGIRYSNDEKDFIRAVDGGGLCNQFTEAQDVITVNGVCRDVRSQNISRAGITPRQWDGRSIPLPPESFGTFVDTSDSWEETTWRLVADYRLDDLQMVYLSYATGFLSGGFSETCATVSLCAYNPETNDNIEIGYKADLFDARLRLAASAYLTTYENLQRAVVAAYQSADGSSQQETVTVNTGGSEATGVDVELTWVPTDQWRVTGAVNWIDHEYDSGTFLPDLRNSQNPQPIDLTQFEVPFSPEWKFLVGASYEWELATGKRVTLNGALNYQDEAQTDVFNGENTQMESRTLVDLSATLHDRDDRWSLTAYANNALDETYPHRRAAGGGPVELHELRPAAFLRADAQHEVPVIAGNA
jgi:iron complex outermembrane recepter protein